jgi:predicted O-methyltransferase YrrM|tara:strand:+ start:527 stop:1156 length:630 start_codon:yes stop_codon:yes gene_type:complete
MTFKYYFRKSSFKKDIESANILLDQIKTYKPKNFLEVGVFQGVTSRNVCEKLYEINRENFSFHGIDIFEDTNSNIDNKEMTTKHNKLSNPLKHLLFNIILKKDLFSIDSIYKFLNKFEDNVHLYKGFSDTELPKVDMTKIDMVFLDGGHSYDTVKNDLSLIIKGIKKGKIIICDDYNQVSYGVKKAVDELINQVYEIKELNKRLVQITV